MGSYAPNRDDNRSEISVLVTGFGSFLEFKTNPAYLIASTLPKTHESAHGPHINIHTSPAPIPVSYKFVRSIVPRLIFSTNSAEFASSASQSTGAKPRYDIVLHIGLADKRDFYTLETQAHRDDYTRKDSNDEDMSNDTFWRDRYHSPEILQTSFHTEDVLKQWNARLPDEDLRSSDDPGRYLCDFIYYTSMVEYSRHTNMEDFKPVMFLHVPTGFEEEDLVRGRRVALGLIEALAKDLLSLRDLKMTADAHSPLGFGREGVS